MLFDHGGRQRHYAIVAEAPSQLPSLLRFRFDEDLRDELATRLKCVRLISGHESCGVTRPASRRALKLCVATGEGKRNLNRVVSVYSGRLSRQANPQAAAARIECVRLPISSLGSGCSWSEVGYEQPSSVAIQAEADSEWAHCDHKRISGLQCHEAPPCAADRLSGVCRWVTQRRALPASSKSSHEL